VDTAEKVFNFKIKVQGYSEDIFKATCKTKIFDVPGTETTTRIIQKYI